MAEMEEDHDPCDLFALLIPEQYRFTRTSSLHHHLCRGPARLPSEGLPAHLLSHTGLRHGNARDGTDVLKVRA